MDNAQRLIGATLSLSPWMLYDAYGKPIAKSPNLTIDQASRLALNQPYQYKGQFGYLADGHTGAYYCMHRFYDPNTGRWLSRDPIGLEGGTNTYSYCAGNPVMGADPSGLDWDDFWGYLRQVGGVFKGYGMAGKNAAIGLLHNTTPLVLFHGAEEWGDWAGHGWSVGYLFDKKGGEITGGVAHFWSGLTGERGPEGFGESYGTVLIFAATVGEGATCAVAAAERGAILESAAKPFSSSNTISNAGRALSKHPALVNETKGTFSKAFRTDVQKNAAANQLVSNFVKNGKRTVGTTARGAQPYVQYFIQGKGGVRFNPKTKTFIGFIEP